MQIEYLISLVAIIPAIVAIGISIFSFRRQNKIDLFEKRFKVYEMFEEILNYYEIVTYFKNTNDINTKIGLYILYYFSDYDNDEIQKKSDLYECNKELLKFSYIFNKLEKQLSILNRIDLIFDINKEDIKILNDFIIAYKSFINEINGVYKENVSKCEDDFSKAYCEMKNKNIIIKLRKQLKII